MYPKRTKLLIGEESKEMFKMMVKLHIESDDVS